jgi:hypothetical protein
MEDILGHWAVLLSEGRKVEANSELENARKIGNILLNKSYDKTLPDEVNSITAASGETQVVLQKGHQAYQAGMRNLRLGRRDSAVPQLDRASKLFKCEVRLSIGQI